MSKPKHWMFRDRSPEGLIIWTVDKIRDRLAVSRDDQKLNPLNPQESLLLECLLDNAGEPCATQLLLTAVWGEQDKVDRRTALGVLLSKLRKIFGPRLLLTLDSKPVYYQFLPDIQDLRERPGDPDHTSSSDRDLVGLTTLKDLRRVATVQPPNVGSLLNPQRCPIPFVGREAEVAQLRTWLTGPAKASLKLVVGHGGRGKTRLAVHLLEWMEANLPEWHAGFLDAGLCKDTLTYKTFRYWHWARPTLIIIDDASRWSHELAEHVVPAACQPLEDALPLRLLLIDRGVDDSYSWYRTLVDAAQHQPSLFASSLALCPLGNVNDIALNERRQLLDFALNALHDFDGQTRLPLDDSIATGLSSEDMGEPLVVLMAAIVAHQRRDLTPFTYRRIDLADAIAAHEAHRITLLAQPDLLPLHMVAYATLTRGLSLADLRAACKEERDSIEPESTWTPSTLKTLIAEKALPSDNPALAAASIVPDVVGEVFIERVLQSSEQYPVETMFRAFQRQPDSVTRTIVNMVHDLVMPANATDNITPRQGRLFQWINMLLSMLGRRASSQDQDGNGSDALVLIANTVALAKKVASIKPVIFIPLVAWNCGIWADILCRRGRANEANGKFAEGLQQIKPLVLGGSREYWNMAVDLASGYCSTCSSAGIRGNNKLSAPFSVLLPGPTSDYAEGISIVRDLIWQMPIERLPGLQLSLEKFTAELGVGVPVLAEEIMRRYDEVSGGDQNAILREQALFFASQGQQWSDADYPREALAAIGKAIPYLSSLTDQKPETFLPHLASSLELQGDLQSRLQLRRECSESITVAVGMYRSLVKMDGAYRHNLAISLWKEAILKTSDHKREAVILLDEAASYIKDEPAGMRYISYRNTLYNLRSLFRWEIGEKTAAIDVLREKCTMNGSPSNIKVTKREIDAPAGIAGALFFEPSTLHSYVSLEFVHHDPYGYSWLRAQSLRIEAEYARQECGSLKTAVALIACAIEDCRWLLEQDRWRFLGAFAEWLDKQRMWLTEDGDLDGALRAIEEVRPYYAELAEKDSSRFWLRLDVLSVSRDLILLRKGTESTPETLKSIREIVAECRTLAAKDRGQFQPCLGEALSLQVELETRSGRAADALVSVIEAIDCYSELVSSDEGLLHLLGGLVDRQLFLMQHGLDHPESIVSSLDAQVYRLSSLTIASRDRFAGILATSKMCRIMAAVVMGDYKVVLDIVQDAIEDYKRLASIVPERSQIGIACLHGIWGVALSESGERNGAVEHLGIGLKLIGPLVLKDPEPNTRTGLFLRDEYLRACAAAEIEPDRRALETLSATLPPLDPLD